jgi:hypothetical protein
MSVNKVKNKYLVLSTEFSVQCDQGKTIYARLSDYPYGLFTDKKAIHVIDEAKYQNHYPFFYMAVSHPELINSKDDLLITYSINNYGPCLEGLSEWQNESRPLSTEGCEQAYHLLLYPVRDKKIYKGPPFEVFLDFSQNILWSPL